MGCGGILIMCANSWQKVRFKINLTICVKPGTTAFELFFNPGVPRMLIKSGKTLVTVAIAFWSLGAFADSSCLVSPAVINCGGKEVKDVGCSVSCSANQGWDALCGSGECHLLADDRNNDDLCKDNKELCIAGADGHKYLLNRSSCFCD